MKLLVKYRSAMSPRYSPDFNPTIRLFSKLKAMLRNVEERTGGGL